MKNLIDIFCTLGNHLRLLSEKEESCEIINQATKANSWFEAIDIKESAKAIAEQMLSRNKLEQWMIHYPTLPAQQRRIALIMAGNIPFVGFFDLLCILMAGHACYAKPSSKDSVLMNYIIDTLKDIEPDIPIYIYNDSDTYDAVIATGGENANRQFKERFKETRKLLRSNRHSIAVLDGTETQQQIEALSEDIYKYSGLGCRNVSMIFTPRGYKLNIPKRNTTAKYRNNYTQTRALYSLSGMEFLDNGCSCFVRSQQLPTSLSTISLFEYDSLKQVEAWIAAHEEELQCIVSQKIAHSRCVDFGQAQHPTLMDYADDIDTMNFLNF